MLFRSQPHFSYALKDLAIYYDINESHSSITLRHDQYNKLKPTDFYYPGVSSNNLNSAHLFKSSQRSSKSINKPNKRKFPINNNNIIITINKNFKTRNGWSNVQSPYSRSVNFSINKKLSTLMNTLNAKRKNCRISNTISQSSKYKPSIIQLTKPINGCLSEAHNYYRVVSFTYS